MARPRKQIDQAIVERLANRQASNPMIAAVVGCSRRTLNRRFGRHLPLWREAGKTKIINAQWDAMERGNIVAAIFLGKQYLGQADKLETTVELPAITDPIDAYQNDPGLLERALQLEKDFADAAITPPIDAGPTDVSRLAVPAPPPMSGGNGDGAPNEG